MAKAVLTGLLALAACGEGQMPFVDHDEPSDFQTSDDKADGLPATFDANQVMEEEFFLAKSSVDGNLVQKFFENTPYHTRSFLADEKVGDRRAADAIVSAAQAAGINPTVMLARMQVEKGLINKTVRPSDQQVNYAFGCGCPDGKACNPAYAGLDKQIACAASTLKSLHDKSQAGTGTWRQGSDRKTLDGIDVVPANHATAALYAYTPWVLVGKGGNWLVWSVTKKYAAYVPQLH